MKTKTGSNWLASFVAGVFVASVVFAAVASYTLSRYQSLDDEVEASRSENDGLKQELAQVKGVVTARETVLENYNRNLSEKIKLLESSLAANNQESGELYNYLLELRREQAELQAFAKELNVLVAALNSENDKLDGDVKQLLVRLAELQEQLENYFVDEAAQDIYAEADYLVHLEVDTKIKNVLGIETTVTFRLSGLVFESDGKQYILTAGHIQGSGEKVTKITVYFKSNSLTTEAVILGLDSKLDVALLKFKDPEFVFEGRLAELGDSDDLKVGDEVYAMGSPLGVRWTCTRGRVINLRFGKTHGYSSFNQDELILHDAIINPGNSGGPLVNAKGQIIGLNVMAVGSKDNNFVTPMAVANKINDVKKALADLMNGVQR